MRPKAVHYPRQARRNEPRAGKEREAEDIYHVGSTTFWDLRTIDSWHCVSGRTFRPIAIDIADRLQRNGSLSKPRA
jgi:hypothetical protein